MKALSYFGKNDVRVVEKPRPRIEHPEDCIVRVTTAAICGSDLHLYHAMMPDLRIGHTFGHECVGIVDEVGADVTAVKPGDRVVVPFNIACGRCFFCQRKLYSQCENVNPYEPLGGFMGYSHTCGGYDGAQAEFVRVPFANFSPRKVPSDLPDRQAVLLADIFPTAYFGCDIADIQRGDTVAVFGCGPVGLLAQKCARQFFGAERVIAVDHVPYRLNTAARECGAEVVDFSKEPDVVGKLKEMTGGRGPDVCIDAVGLEADGSPLRSLAGALSLEAGSITALVWAMSAVRNGGHISVIGVYGPPFNNFFPLGVAMNRNLSIKMGQCNVNAYLEDLMQRTHEGQIDPSFVVTHEIPLARAPKGYEVFEQKRDGAIKVLLHPSQPTTAAA